MKESKAECFLRMNRPKIVDGVTNVDSLVDALIKEGLLSKEKGNEVLTLDTSQRKMRRLLSYLNSNKAHESTVKWLKENEPNLVEDFENNNDSDHEGPAIKRPRGCVKDVDETDCDPSRANLKTFPTFAKLEEWVSNSKNSQKLIDTLKNRLADGEMEALEEELKDKKLKKGLYFSLNDIKDIDRNRKLKSFIKASKDAKFPDLPIKLFFEKIKGHASAAHESMTEKDDKRCLDDDDNVFGDQTADDFNSSGYGSSLSSSNNSKHFFSQIEGQLQSDNLSAAHEHTESRDDGYNEKKTTVSKPLNTDVPSESEQRRPAGEFDVPIQTQELHAAKVQNVTCAQTQPKKEDCALLERTTVEMQETRNGPFKAETFQSTTPSETTGSLMQNEGTMNCDLVPFTKFENIDIRWGSGFSKQGQELPVDQHQNVVDVQMQQASKNGTPLQKTMDMQETICEPFTGKPCAVKPLQPTNLSVAPSDPIQSEDPKATQEFSELHNISLFEQTDMPPLKSDVSKQASFTTSCQTSCVDVAPYDPMQSEGQQKNHDPDPRTKSEGADMASQKEYRVSAFPKQTRELSAVGYQNGSVVKIHLEDKGSTPEEAMDVQVSVNEPFTGKPCAAKPLPSTTLSVATDNPMQSDDPKATQEKSESHPIPEQTDMPPLKSDVSKQESFTAEPSQTPCVDVAADDPMQIEGPQNNRNPDTLTKFEGADMASQKESKVSDFPKHAQELSAVGHPNGSRVQIYHEDKDATPEEAMDVQVSVNEQFTGKPCAAKPLPSTNLSVATNPMQSEDTKATQEISECHPISLFDQTDMPPLKSDASKQASLTAEPFQTPSVDVAADDPTQIEGPQKNHDPDALTKSEGADMASQKECKVSAFPKQTRELSAVGYQNGSVVKIHLEDKGSTPEEAMDVQVSVNEPFTGKPCAAKLLPSTTLSVATSDPMQSEDPKAIQETSELHPISLFGQTSTPPLVSNVPVQTEHLHFALHKRPDVGDDAPLQKPVDMHRTVASNGPLAAEPNHRGTVADSLQGKDVGCTGPKWHSDTVKKQIDGTSHCDTGDLPVELCDDIMPSTSGEWQSDLCSTLINNPPKTAEKPKERKQSNRRELSKTNEKYKLLFEWAKKKQEVEKVLDRISIKNHVEHSEFPFFTAEDVIVYEESENDNIIIVTDGDKSELVASYQMWVCGIDKALLINREEREIEYDSRDFQVIIKRCEEFIVKALAPTLAVFKTTQRQKLYSFIE